MSLCPYCDHDNNAATSVDSPDSKILPGKGDVSICLYCANIAVFTGDGFAVRRPTEAEHNFLMADEQIARAVALVEETWLSE